jgi:hypothetical protein
MGDKSVRGSTVNKLLIFTPNNMYCWCVVSVSSEDSKRYNKLGFLVHFRDFVDVSIVGSAAVLHQTAL